MNSDCKNLLKEYFKDLKCKPTKIYKEFLNSINDENLTPLKEQTLKNISKNLYEYEDLAALIYIKSYLNPNKKFTEIRHAVIDEAQDLGLFNYYVMKKALSNATFSIYGDLAQSIYDYRSITNFDEVKEKIFNNEAEIIGFTKSLAKEVASRNITVNAVAPGFIDTQMTAVLKDDIKEDIAKKIPLKRIISYITISYILLKYIYKYYKTFNYKEKSTKSRTY